MYYNLSIFYFPSIATFYAFQRIENWQRTFDLFKGKQRSNQNMFGHFSLNVLFNVCSDASLLQMCEHISMSFWCLVISILIVLYFLSQYWWRCCKTYWYKNESMITHLSINLFHCWSVEKRRKWFIQRNRCFYNCRCVPTKKYLH